MTEQSKAQRLAERLDLWDYYEFDAGLHCPDAAAELRRLDALNTELVEALEEIVLEATSYREDVWCKKLAEAALAKATGKYNLACIAWELERTAVGDGFHGNALRVAKDIPGLTNEDRALLDRYATGINGGTDHVALQDLALRIDEIAKAKEQT